MKQYFLFLLVFSAFHFSCKQSSQQKDVDGGLVQNPATLSGDSSKQHPAVMTFETMEHDFGKIQEGDKVVYDFNFTNSGEIPLLISNVKASCGCTTPHWPKELIQPGASNKITVEYNSKGREGEFNKGIAITANTYPNVTTLKISGVVFKK